MKRVDRIVGSDAAGLDSKDQTNVRFYVAMDVACTATGKACPTPQDVAAISASGISDAAIFEALDRVLRIYRNIGPTDQTAKGTALVENLKADLTARLGKSAKDVDNNR
jgi:hypothetical protein